MASRDWTECSVCMEELNEPRALPCLHTFCTHCLSKMVRPTTSSDVVARSIKSDSFLVCPICKESHGVPRAGVTGFRKNFIVENLRSTTVGNSQGERDGDKCSEHSLDMKLFCEDCSKVICSECYVEDHMGHKTTKVADRARDGRARAESIVEAIDERRKMMAHHMAVLRMLTPEKQVNAVERQIDENLEKVKRALEENAAELKEKANKTLRGNEDVIAAQLEKLSLSAVQLTDLKNDCEEVRGSSDAKLLNFVDEFVEKAKSVVEENLNGDLEITNPIFTPAIGASEISGLALGMIETTVLPVALGDTEVDPDLVKEEEKKFNSRPASTPPSLENAALQSAEKSASSPTENHFPENNNEDPQPFQMQQMFNNLLDFPALNDADPLAHFSSMYTYDSPEPRTTTTATTNTTNTYENTSGASPTNNNAAMSVSDPAIVYDRSSADSVTWMDLSGYRNFGQSSLMNIIGAGGLENVNSTASQASNGNGGVNQSKTWSTVLKNSNSTNGISDASPVIRSASTGNVARSVHSSSGSPHRVASPAASAASLDAYDSAESNSTAVDPAIIRATRSLSWQWVTNGHKEDASVLGIGVTMSGHVGLIEDEAFSVYEDGTHAFSSQRKYAAKALAFITVENVEYAVELHRDHVLRFNVFNGIRPLLAQPTYFTRRFTQFQLNSASNKLFITYKGNQAENEVDNMDYIEVYDCRRLPPMPYNHFSTGVKGMRSMCVVDTPRGIVVILMLSNKCERYTRPADVCVLAFDTNGKLLWQLMWNIFSEVQIIAGRVRYDFKAACSDDRAIYVLEKLAGTVYAIDREGRKVKPILKGLGNSITHMTVNKQKKELILLNSEGVFTHYKLTY